jgi:hypothetical protein
MLECDSTMVDTDTRQKFSDKLPLANGAWGTLKGRIAIEALGVCQHQLLSITISIGNYCCTECLDS